MMAAASPSGAECTAVSGPQRLALVELYTSEGCSSCPPADRWLSALRKDESLNERIVALAFHVDYWNKLGWGFAAVIIVLAIAANVTAFTIHKATYLKPDAPAAGGEAAAH